MAGNIFSSLIAEQRIYQICDKDTFKKITSPILEVPSPHLQNLNLPIDENDGVIIGSGAIGSYKLLLISQDGSFYGGSVGEIHGAKIKGILDYALINHPDAVIFVIDSGGVRLQEANAGLVALSEVMKSLLNLRYVSIPVIAIIPGKIGAFGGMGILARLCTRIIMTKHAKMGLSGPEVIETLKGIEEFNSQNKDIVYETVGAIQRYEIGEIDIICDDRLDSVRYEIIKAITELKDNPVLLHEEIFTEHILLKERINKIKNE